MSIVPPFPSPDAQTSPIPSYSTFCISCDSKSTSPSNSRPIQVRWRTTSLCMLKREEGVTYSPIQSCPFPSASSFFSPTTGTFASCPLLPSRRADPTWCGITTLRFSSERAESGSGSIFGSPCDRPGALACCGARPLPCDQVSCPCSRLVRFLFCFLPSTPDKIGLLYDAHRRFSPTVENVPIRPDFNPSSVTS